MKLAEMKEKNLSEMKKYLEELLHEQFNLRMRHAAGQLNQNHLLKQGRKNIARVKTLMKEKMNGSQL